MDPVHTLSAQAFTRTGENRPATSGEVDAFYESHGHEAFARAYRLRQRIRTLAARLRTPAPATRRFAAPATNR